MLTHSVLQSNLCIIDFLKRLVHVEEILMKSIVPVTNGPYVHVCAWMHVCVCLCTPRYSISNCDTGKRNRPFSLWLQALPADSNMNKETYLTRTPLTSDSRSSHTHIHYVCVCNICTHTHTPTQHVWTDGAESQHHIAHTQTHAKQTHAVACMQWHTWHARIHTHANKLKTPNDICKQLPFFVPFKNSSFLLLPFVFC